MAQQGAAWLSEGAVWLNKGAAWLSRVRPVSVGCGVAQKRVRQGSVQGEACSVRVPLGSAGCGMAQ
jgi:hypothetical protein